MPIDVEELVHLPPREKARIIDRLLATFEGVELPDSEWAEVARRRTEMQTMPEATLVREQVWSQVSRRPT